MILIVCTKLLYDFWYKTMPVHLIEIARLETEQELPGEGWLSNYGDFQSLEAMYGIDIPELDFNKYCLIMSFGREIKQLTYTRISRFQTSYRNRYLGREILKRPLYPHTIFVYKAEKIKLISEEGAGFSPPRIRIED